MQFLGIGSDLLRELCAWLCEFIYQLIAWLYELFINVSRVEILKADSPAIKSIYERITMILTIVMIFYVTFEVVKYVMQPDSFSDKEKGGGKLVLKMILVVILIAFVPSIFTWAYKFQNVIFDNQIFSKVILGKQGIDTERYGRVFSANILGMFYYVDEATWGEQELEKESNCDGVSCKTIVNANLSTLIEYGEITLLNHGINKEGEVVDEGTGDVSKYYIHFDGLFAVIVGIFVAYMLMLYCVDVGVRAVQLLFLQIIAPIPIIGYLSPKKDGIFQKWVKQCITTYLDLFIRTGIIYFGVLICQILSESYNSGDLFNNIPGDTTTTMKVFIYIALILGVLLFIQKAPKLLGELFPKMGAASGNFGLKAGERVAPMAARAIGAGLGAKRFIGGAISRAHNNRIRNKANGAKSILTSEGRKQFGQRINNQLNRFARKNDVKRAEKIEDQKQSARKNLQKEVAKRDEIKQRVGADYKNNKEWQAADKKVKDMAKKETQRLDNIRMKDKEYKAKREASDAKRQELFESLKIQSVNDPNLTAEQRKTLANKNRETFKEYQVNEQVRQTGLKTELEELNIKAATSPLSIDDKNRKAELEAEINGGTALDEMKKRASETSIKMQEMSNINDATQKLYQAEEQVVEAQNKKHKSVVGAGLWGAVAGAATGAYYGSKATKLEEIIPKAKEGAKHDIDKINAVKKYYDEGGTGFINRTATQLEKKIGMDTAYVARNLQTQALESQIKKYDSTISVADNAKKSFDATEDRLKAKLLESKCKVSKDEEPIKIGEGIEPLVIKKGDSYADVLRNEQSKVDTKASIAQQAARLQEEYYKANQAAIENGDQTKNAEYKKLKEDAEAKSKEATDYKYRATQVEKKLARHLFTEMLHGHVEGEDAVARENLTTQLNDVKIATQDSKICEYIYKNKPELYNAFLSGRFQDYDQLDTTIATITAAKNEQIREKQAAQAQVSRNQTSNTTQAQRAANDYNGGSGK